jgi:hypothetical protein
MWRIAMITRPMMWGCRLGAEYGHRTVPELRQSEPGLGNDRGMLERDRGVNRIISVEGR